MGQYIFIYTKGQYKSVLEHSYSLLLYGAGNHPYYILVRRHSGIRLVASARHQKPLSFLFSNLPSFYRLRVAETPRELILGVTGVPELESTILFLRALSLHFLDYCNGTNSPNCRLAAGHIHRWHRH
jgi:hypothetical protein